MSEERRATDRRRKGPPVDPSLVREAVTSSVEEGLPYIENTDARQYRKWFATFCWNARAALTDLAIEAIIKANGCNRSEAIARYAELIGHAERTVQRQLVHKPFI